MAITVIAPNSLCFARNPIVFRATTDKLLGEDESLLRIVCYATFSVPDEITFSGQRTFQTELSQPVSDAGTAVFNLSDSSQTLFNRMMPDGLRGDFMPQGVDIFCYFEELWVRDGYEVRGSRSINLMVNVVPGGETDVELLVRGHAIDLVQETSDKIRPMTRKPDLGLLYSGEELILPILHDSDGVFHGTVTVAGSEQDLFDGLIRSRRTGVITAEMPLQGNDGEVVLSGSVNGYNLPSLTGRYHRGTSGVHFLRFINGFGAMENISVRSRDSLSFSIEGSSHSLVQDISVMPTDRRYSIKSQPVGEFKLSSGYVPMRWAQWFVQEFLTTPRAWILINNVWLPAVIEAEDECVIYDRTKPEMPHVDFTLRLAVDGVTGCAW